MDPREREFITYKKLLQRGLIIIRMDATGKRIERLFPVVENGEFSLRWKQIQETSTCKHCRELFGDMLRIEGTISPQKAYWRVVARDMGFDIYRTEENNGIIKKFVSHGGWSFVEKGLTTEQINLFMRLILLNDDNALSDI